MTIAISAGHHPDAKGASFGEFNEHDEAMQWAYFLVDMLHGDAVLVPTGKLSTKIDWINSQPDITCAIEIHFNSAMDTLGNHIGQGCETLFCPGSMLGHDFANTIHAELAKVFKPDRGVKEGYYQMNPIKGPDAFLGKIKVPSIILEPEFIHHVDTIKNNRVDGCFAIAQGLIKYKESLHV